MKAVGATWALIAFGDECHREISRTSLIQFAAVCAALMLGLAFPMHAVAQGEQEPRASFGDWFVDRLVEVGDQALNVLHPPSENGPRPGDVHREIGGWARDNTNLVFACAQSVTSSSPGSTGRCDNMWESATSSLGDAIANTFPLIRSARQFVERWTSAFDTLRDGAETFIAEAQSIVGTSTEVSENIAGNQEHLIASLDHAEARRIAETFDERGAELAKYGIKSEADLKIMDDFFMRGLHKSSYAEWERLVGMMPKLVRQGSVSRSVAEVVLGRPLTDSELAGTDPAPSPPVEQARRQEEPRQEPPLPSRDPVAPRPAAPPEPSLSELQAAAARTLQQYGGADNSYAPPRGVTAAPPPQSSPGFIDNPTVQLETPQQREQRLRGAARRYEAAQRRPPPHGGDPGPGTRPESWSKPHAGPPSPPPPPARPAPVRGVQPIPRPGVGGRRPQPPSSDRCMQWPQCWAAQVECCGKPRP